MTLSARSSDARCVGALELSVSGYQDGHADEVQHAAEQTFVASSSASQSRDWRAHAACRHEDPELFFPPGRGEAAVDQIAAAKDVCARCPVRRECLEFAMVHRQRDGIWGGLTDQERRRHR